MGSIRHSVFLKLTLILVATALLINFFVVTGIQSLDKSHHHGFETMRRNMNLFMDLVADELMKNPSLENGKVIAKKYSLNIRAEGAVNWTTSDSVPPAREVLSTPIGEPYRRPPIFPVVGPPHHGPPPVVIAKRFPQGGAVEFTFLGPKPPSSELDYQILILLISLLTGVFWVSYLAIRRTLQPLKSLAAGVKEIGQGNFDFSVEAKSQDEFGNLARLFNTMTQQVKDMIKAKEQLLLDVSHELRSPLTRAKVALEMMPQSDTRTDISGEIAEMEEMVTGLLESARLKSPYRELHLSDVNVHALLKDISDKFRTPSMSIQLNAPRGPVMMWVDGERLKRVLTNLIDNAVKYSGVGTPVVLHLRDLGQNVVFEIIDSGAGIPKSEISRVFEPFYRVDKSRNRATGGYGLGLNLCRTIAEAHGGKIELLSEEGRGTQVVLTLPKRATPPRG